jgi:altronate dehydratase
LADAAATTFAGYRRPDGRYGVHNHVLLLGQNGLVARAAGRIAQAGGTAVFGETIEWLGAEHLPARPARSADRTGGSL